MVIVSGFGALTGRGLQRWSFSTKLKNKGPEGPS